MYDIRLSGKSCRAVRRRVGRSLAAENFSHMLHVMNSSLGIDPSYKTAFDAVNLDLLRCREELGEPNDRKSRAPRPMRLHFRSIQSVSDQISELLGSHVRIMSRLLAARPTGMWLADCEQRLANNRW